MDVTSAPPLGQSAGHLAAAFSTVRTSVLAETATKLGISIDQLRAELDAGQPLAHIAALAGISLTAGTPVGPPVVVQQLPRDGQVDLQL
jgi:hypothetical protein